MDIKSVKKTIKIYTLVVLISIIFSYIYERFSYGAYSNFMRFLFIVPLFANMIYIIIYLKKIKINRISYNLWNSGIAILMSGMIIKGIINISGRYSEYDYIYWLFGILFLLIAIIFNLKTNLNKY